MRENELHIINLMCASFRIRSSGMGWDGMWVPDSRWRALFWETCLGRSSRSKRRHSVLCLCLRRADKTHKLQPIIKLDFYKTCSLNHIEFSNCIAVYISCVFEVESFNNVRWYMGMARSAIILILIILI